MEDVVLQYPPKVGPKFVVGLVQDAKYFQQNIRGDHYAKVYDERAFDYLGYRLTRRGKRKFDNRIVITGPPRTGKSTIAVTWAKTINPDLAVDNVSFRLADFKEKLAALPPADPEHRVYPIAILDESGVDLYSKDWATVWVKNMAKVFQIVGKKRLTMILNLPHMKMLAKDMRDQMKFWVNTLDDEEEDRGYCEIRISKYNAWASPYWNPLMGLMFKELSGKWWAEYESAKDDFIDDFTGSDEGQPIPQRIQKLMQQRDAALKELRKNHTTREIEEITGVDQSRVVRASQTISPLI